MAISTYWFENFIGVFLIALVLSGIIIPQILLVAFRRKLFDEQDERKIHKGVVPRLGGFAFLPSIVFALCLLIAISLLEQFPMMESALTHTVLAVLFLLCGLMLIFLVGMADDLIGVKYSAKFVVQIIVAILLIGGGAVLNDLHGVIGFYLLPNWLGWLFSILLMVYIINAINLIDGIDGLASGLSMIAMISYGIMFYLAGLYIYSMIAWATLGTLMPFFYYNFFGDPKKKKKIFMGDTGSLTIGTIISFLSLSMTNIVEYPEIEGYNPIICAFAPVIVPTFDVLRVYFHRVRRHRNPFLPDRCHIHHKLLALGLSTRKALAVIIIVAVIFLLSNILLSRSVNPNILVGSDIVIWTAGNLLLSHLIRRREARLGTKLYD